MKNKTVTIIVLSALALGLNACMDMKNAMDMPEGKSERSSISTDAYGTKTERQSSTEVDVDDEGNRKTIVKSKVTKDPKGIMNKRTTSQTRKVVADPQY